MAHLSYRHALARDRIYYSKVRSMKNLGRPLDADPESCLWSDNHQVEEKKQGSGNLNDQGRDFESKYGTSCSSRTSGKSSTSRKSSGSNGSVSKRTSTANTSIKSHDVQSKLNYAPRANKISEYRTSNEKVEVYRKNAFQRVQAIKRQEKAEQYANLERLRARRASNELDSIRGPKEATLRMQRKRELCRRFSQAALDEIVSQSTDAVHSLSLTRMSNDADHYDDTKFIRYSSRLSREQELRVERVMAQSHFYY